MSADWTFSSYLYTLTFVVLSFFSHCSLSFSMSVTLNRRSVTSWYKPWGGGKNSHYPLNTDRNLQWGGLWRLCGREFRVFLNRGGDFQPKAPNIICLTLIPLERIWEARSAHGDKSWTKREATWVITIKRLFLITISSNNALWRNCD